MTRYNLKQFFFLLFVALQTVTRLNAQIIVPRQAPIILKLNTSGVHEVKLNEVTFSGASASATTTFSPASFDCDNTGLQQVLVTNSTLNGTAVSFNNPAGLTIDSFGNLYVADMAGEKIRKITPAGIVTTLAGSGNIGNTDGKGTTASFNNPNGLAVDADGNIYVADMNNHVIRKITQNGNVITFAGNGRQGNADGTGTSASFNAPTGLAIDATGNLYVVDEFNNNIRKIDVDGIVTTLAGDMSGYADGLGKAASFALPYGITIGADGNLYVTDIQNYRVRKITPQGLVSTFAGNGTNVNKDGTGTSASFDSLYGIADDATGMLYVYSGSQLRKITPQATVTTIAGGISAGKPIDSAGLVARLNHVAALVPDGAGNFYFTDTYSNLIRMITPAGAVTTIAGNGVAVSKDGNIGNVSTIGYRQKYIPVTIVPTLIITRKPADVTVDYNGCPPLLKGYTVSTDDYCQDLNLKSIRPKDYSLDYHQIPAPGTLLQNNVPANVKIIITDSNGATDSVSFNVTAVNGGKIQSSSVNINASQNPVCAGNAVKFTPVIDNPPPSVVLSWYVNGKLQVYDDSYTTSNLKDGDTVTCVLGAGNSLCNTPVSSEPYIVVVITPPAISFGNNPLIEPGNSVQLKPVITGGKVIKYNWSPPTGLNNANVEQPLATPLETTNYTLTITTESGCTAQQTVKVSVDTDLHIPNTFTPNGDGVNDTWAIKSLLIYPQCSVRIFNRYGQQVYYSLGYSGWDGTFKGQPLPVGTYYYIIKTTVSNPTFAGNVTIIR